MPSRFAASAVSEESLNEVRPRRPEQFALVATGFGAFFGYVSMKSGLEGRNNKLHRILLMPQLDDVSMKSGLEGRNNWSGRTSR